MNKDIKYTDVCIDDCVFTVKLEKVKDFFNYVKITVMRQHPHPKTRFQRIKEFWTEEFLGEDKWYENSNHSLKKFIEDACDSVKANYLIEQNFINQWDNLQEKEM